MEKCMLKLNKAVEILIRRSGRWLVRENEQRKRSEKATELVYLFVHRSNFL